MPAVLFNVWNPYVTADGDVAFEVTQADTFRIHRASKELVDAALQALHVEAVSKTWQVLAGRSLYYSDDPKHSDWRNRWVRTWQIRVVPEVPLPPRRFALFREPASLGLSDPSWPDEEPAELQARERQDHTALIIVDFQKAREEVSRLAEAGWAQLVIGASVRQELRELADGVCQLHAVIEGASLSSEMDKLDAVLASFRAAGGASDWRARLTWQAAAAPMKPEMSAWLGSLGLPPRKP